MQLSALLNSFEGFWPSSQADDWDRVGLTVGDPNDEVSKILVAVDMTESVFDEALAAGVQMILTHHPFLLRGIDSVAEDRLKGRLLTKLIRSNIALFSAHTNADVQNDGASSLMAKTFGLANLKPLVSTGGGFGHGVIGTLSEEMDLASFAAIVSNSLPKTARKVVFSGEPSCKVSTVAVCSGAGDSFIPQVLQSEADVYVTSDLRHHPTLDAISTPREIGGLNLIDVSHWAAESLWVSGAVKRIESLGAVNVIASALNTDPWTHEVN